MGIALRDDEEDARREAQSLRATTLAHRREAESLRAEVKVLRETTEHATKPDSQLAPGSTQHNAQQHHSPPQSGRAYPSARISPGRRKVQISAAAPDHVGRKLVSSPLVSTCTQLCTATTATATRFCPTATQR